jgi:hypothetical protein
MRFMTWHISHNIFVPYLCSTPKVYSLAHWVEQFFFLNAHLIAPPKNRMIPLNSPESLSAQKSILKRLNNTSLHVLQLIGHNTLPPYSNSFVLCKAASNPNV